MCENSRVNVKVEPRSTFTLTFDLPYIVSIIFTHVKPVKVYVRTHVKITRRCGEETLCISRAYSTRLCGLHRSWRVRCQKFTFTLRALTDP